MRRLGIYAFGVTLVMAMGLSACGGSDEPLPPPPPSEGSATIDAAGGEVAGPDGVKLMVPAGALATATTVRIARDGSGAPEIGGSKLISPIYAITPHGTAFAQSARISIPFRPADLAPGTQPVLMRAQPGGNWEALFTDVQGGTFSAADTPGLSFYAVGTCYTSRDTPINGPDPLLYCPSAHTLQLTLRDGNGALLPVPRNGAGVAQPVMTISAPTTLTYTLSWTRPVGTQRSDRVWMQISDAGLPPAQQPLLDFAVNRDFTQTFTTTIDPATVPDAGVAGGKVIRLRASVVYTTDAFYPGCVCFRQASWNFVTEIPVRVVYAGTAPVVTQQPSPVAVSEGQPASFTVSATGANLSAVWSRGRGAAPNDLSPTVVPMPTGSASFTIPVTSVAAHDGWAYGAQVCSNRGVANLERCVLSNAAQLNVAAVTVAPIFTTQPASVTVIAGQTASLTAVASGQPAPTIEWSRLVGSGLLAALQPICSPTTGTGNSTSATCTTAPLTVSDSGMRIQALATNGPNGINAVSSAVATITVLPQSVAPSITTPAEPADRTVQEGGSVTWTVGAAGTAPLSYAWRTVTPSGGVIGGIICEGGYSGASANGPTVTLANIPFACNGHRFFVIVSNGVNPAAESRRALLTVTPASAAPTITSGLSNRSVVEGTQLTFSVAATGSPASFSYVWTLDGAAIPNVVSGCGSASATCTFTAQLPDSGKVIAVRVANGINPDATSSATLTVTSTDVPASITAQPVSQNVVAGDTAVFTIGVAGTPAPSVQWQTSSDGITWAAAGTGNALTIPNAAVSQNGLRVRALVSNTTRVPGGTQLNSVTSNEALLAVGNNLPPNALLATQITTHVNRTLAVHPNGDVYAWGNYVDPLSGAFSTGGIWAKQPVRVQGLGPVRQVAIGSDYASWALAADGTVWGWGQLIYTGAFAQGPGDTGQYLAPVRLLTAANTPIDRVCHIEGTFYGVVMVRSDVLSGTCAPSEPRSVWYTANITGNEHTSAGYAVRYGQLDSGSLLVPAGRWINEVVTSRAYSNGPASAFAIANDGVVYAWGTLNREGQLGLGNNNQPNLPQLAPGWQGALKIAVSAEVTLALMADGSIKGAGWNPNASLGIGPVSFTSVSTPTTLANITGASEVSTASSNSSSMALVGGQLRYWGNNPLLDPAIQVTPVAIAAPVAPFTAVSVGGRHALAIGPGNAVYSWGDPNYRGCAPNSTTCNSSTSVPTLVTVP